MATKEETRARLETLKKDQETLKRELAALDTFIEKKARRAPPRQERQQYKEPARGYAEPQREYAEPPRYREPVPRYSEPAYREDDMYELMRRNLDESRKMMDKFDYLLDTLISSMEEVEGENTDELIKALAQSQMHTMEVLASIKGVMDQASEEAVTKQELDELERDQASHYQELNKKMSVVMEQMQNPPYLQELDQIRVQVTGLQTELGRLQKEGLKVGGISDEFKESVKSLKTQADALAERMGNIHSSLENINEHINQVQATTAQLAQLKQQMAKMRDMLSAKDDAILNDSQVKISRLESRMAQLNETAGKLKAIEEKLSMVPVGELAGLSEEIKSLKASLPATSIKDIQAKLGKIEKELDEELKKKQDEEEDRKILLRLVKKEAQLSDEVDGIGERLAGSEAAETYARMALENKVAALESCQRRPSTMAKSRISSASLAAFRARWES